MWAGPAYRESSILPNSPSTDIVTDFEIADCAGCTTLVRRFPAHRPKIVFRLTSDWHQRTGARAAQLDAAAHRAIGVSTPQAGVLTWAEVCRLAFRDIAVEK